MGVWLGGEGGWDRAGEVGWGGGERGGGSGWGPSRAGEGGRGEKDVGLG